MMYLSKEATNKNQSSKMQMVLPIDKMNHQMLKENGKKTAFLKTKKVKKPNFPENTLIYCNQGYERYCNEIWRLCNMT